MGESASMANRTVFLIDDVVLVSVSDDVVVYLDDEDMFLFKGSFLGVFALGVFLSTPKSRSCTVLMCKAAKLREASSCSWALQSTNLLLSMRFLYELTSGRPCRC